MVAFAILQLIIVAVLFITLSITVVETFTGYDHYEFLCAAFLYFLILSPVPAIGRLIGWW